MHAHKPQTRIDTYQALAPSTWASYLVNGDQSLPKLERELADHWIKRMALGNPVSSRPAGYNWSHDAMHEVDEGSDCDLYLFHVEERE